MLPSTPSEKKNNNRIKKLIAFFEAGAPKKRPVRSASTPPEAEQKPVEAGDVSVDDLLVRFGEASIDAGNSTQSEPNFFTPIRNRRSSSVANRISEEFEALLAQRRLQMGQIKRKDQPRFGLGGGVLISESHMLVTKHSFGSQNITESTDLTGYNIQFEYLNSTSYQIERVLSDNQAKELGLLSGIKGDLMVIELKPDNQGYPGKNNNFTALKEPTNKKPGMLHFMGYTSGTTLKESSMPGRPIEMTDIARRGIDAVGQEGSWNDFKTHGNIVKQTPEKSSTQFTIETHARTHEFSVTEQDVFRKNGTLANENHEFYILYPNIFSNDHVVLAHRTRGGSSGGIYFTKEGEIFAVHCGRLPSQKDYPEHIAFYPWTPTTITFYKGILIHEAKQITLADWLKNYLNAFKTNQYSLHLEGSSIGSIEAVNKEEEGTKFIVKPLEEEKESFSFIVPFYGQDNIDINGTQYTRAQITLAFQQTVIQEAALPEELPEALYRVSLDDLKAGCATNEIPVEEQQELAERIIKKKDIKHSMTEKNMRFEHITIGDAQQKGAHYEFVRENNDQTIAIHAKGCHKDKTSYFISKCSPTFKKSAVENKLWSESNSRDIFRLKK